MERQQDVMSMYVSSQYEVGKYVSNVVVGVKSIGMNNKSTKVCNIYPYTLL